MLDVVKVTLALLLAAAAGAANATAASEGQYVIGNGDTIKLSGTSVVCAAASGSYGAVLVCQKSGSQLRVWIGQKEVFLSKGPITNPNPIVTFNGWKTG